MIIDAHTKERRAWIKRGCTDDDPSERYVALAGVAMARHAIAQKIAAPVFISRLPSGRGCRVGLLSANGLAGGEKSGSQQGANKQ